MAQKRLEFSVPKRRKLNQTSHAKHPASIRCEFGCGKYFATQNGMKLHGGRYCKKNDKNKTTTEASTPIKLSIGTEIVSDAAKSKAKIKSIQTMPAETSNTSAQISCEFECGKYFTTQKGMEVHRGRYCKQNRKQLKTTEASNPIELSISTEIVSDSKISKAKRKLIQTTSAKTSNNLIQISCEFGCGKNFATQQGMKIHRARFCKQNEKTINNTEESIPIELSISTQIVAEAEKSKTTLRSLTETNISQPCRFCQNLILKKDLKKHEARDCSELNRILKSNKRKLDQAQDKTAQKIACTFCLRGLVKM